jgi:tRNA modification GTPase
VQAAVTTAGGAAGIATVEVLGTAPLAAVLHRLARWPAGAPEALHVVTLRDLQGEELDTAVLRWRPLGDGTLEHLAIHVHGGPAIRQRLLDCLKSLGVRILPGEELVEALAVAAGAGPRAARCRGLLGRARTLRAAAIIADQADGALERWQQSLTGLVAADQRRSVAAVRARARLGAACLTPPRVALRGRPGAGATSLVNALAGTVAGLVGPDGGTTRDVLVTPVLVAGMEVELLDVPAGTDPGAAPAADLVLEVVDGRLPAPPCRGLRVSTFADRPGFRAQGGVPCASVTGTGLAAVRESLAAALGLSPPDTPPGSVVPLDAPDVELLAELP